MKIYLFASIAVFAFILAGPFDAAIAAVPDGYEPDDTSAQATSISSGSPQTHSISPAGDVDWVTFTLLGTSGVVIETSGPSGDTRMWLYDNGLSEIEFDDDDGPGLFSRIDRVCGIDPLAAGTYYVMLDTDRGFRNVKILAEAVTATTATPATTAAAPTITLLTPLNQSAKTRGDSYAVTWQVTGLKTVRVEVSFDGGQSFRPLATLPAETPRFLWYVPSGQAMTDNAAILRIADDADPTTQAVRRITFTAI